MMRLYVRCTPPPACPQYQRRPSRQWLRGLRLSQRMQVQRRALFLLGLLGCSLGLGAGASSAQAATALLTEAQIEGTLAPTPAAMLRDAAQSALRAQQLELTPDSDLAVAYSGEPMFRTCRSELCLERLGRLLDTQTVVNYSVKPEDAAAASSRAWQLKVQVLDVDAGAFGAQLTEECPRCTDAQAAEKLGALVRRAVTTATSLPKGTLEISSQPSGATVFVDGTELGITPYKRTAFAGKHKLVLRHLGYRSEQAEVSVDASKLQHTEVKLTAGSDALTDSAEGAKAPVYKKWWFWTAIGGAAILAAGAVTAAVVLSSSSAMTRSTPANTYVFTF